MLDGVETVVDDFGLDDGDETVTLTGTGIFGEVGAVSFNSFIGRGENDAIIIETNFEGGAPFGEAETHFVIFGEARVERIETFGVGFFGTVKRLEALVYLDARDETARGEKIDVIAAVIGDLASGFIEKDDTGGEFFELRGGEEDIAVIATIFISILDV